MRFRESLDEAASIPTTSYPKGLQSGWRVSNVLNAGTEKHSKQIKFLVEQYPIRHK